ncbi:MAG: helix-turn-helix domain-containing protein [Candidatus Wallbacteria bacterium]|nr:helix-turn-helix domain-containing protein [Candidatus Wallbacteria bacterium]
MQAAFSIALLPPDDGAYALVNAPDGPCTSGPLGYIGTEDVPAMLRQAAAALARLEAHHGPVQRVIVMRAGVEPDGDRGDEPYRPVFPGRQIVAVGLSAVARYLLGGQHVSADADALDLYELAGLVRSRVNNMDALASVAECLAVGAALCGAAQMSLAAQPTAGVAEKPCPESSRPAEGPTPSTACSSSPVPASRPPPRPTATRWLSVADVISEYAISRRTLYRLVADGDVRAYRQPGFGRRFRREDLDAFIAAGLEARGVVRLEAGRKSRRSRAKTPKDWEADSQRFGL